MCARVCGQLDAPYEPECTTLISIARDTSASEKRHLIQGSRLHRRRLLVVRRPVDSRRLGRFLYMGQFRVEWAPLLVTAVAPIHTRHDFTLSCKYATATRRYSLTDPLFLHNYIGGLLFLARRKTFGVSAPRDIRRCCDPTLKLS
jgi:hypothetical protein